jgi:polyisoprenoid-binding protein YceI
MRIRLIAALFGASFGLVAQPANYQLDPAQTRVSFTLSDVLHTVHGAFKLKSGDIQFDPATGAARGRMIVDAASGNSGNGSRDGKMHKSILESERYPEIVFRPDRVEGNVAPRGASDVRVHGIFSIHGAEHEITIPARVQMTPGQFSADLRFTVPYVKWGMKNPSTFLLRVSQEVEIDIHALASASGRIESRTTTPE